MAGMRQFFRFALGLTLMAELSGPPATWAQTARGKRAAGGGMEIEEITVTAQKREENLQEVPISVTALTGGALTEKGASSVSDLGQAVPNLYMSRAGFGSSATVPAMRGISNPDPSPSSNSTVGMYLDGVYIAKILGSNFDLEDLDRVEVLRGPQGTLFGRNTTSGAINMVTRKPTEERSITASTEVGNFDAFKGRITLNLPLIGKNGFLQSDAFGTLSLRENAVYTAHDGYVRNQSPTDVPATGASAFNKLNRVFSMTSLRWQPTKDLTLDYSFEYHRYNNTPPGYEVSAIFPKGDPNYSPTVSPGGPFDLTPYVHKNRVDTLAASAMYGSDMKLRPLADAANNHMHILTGTWEVGELSFLGNVTLKSISHFRDFRSGGRTDIDGSPLHVLDSNGFNNFDTWSQELQWNGTAARVHYILGLYYYGERSSRLADTVLYGGGVNFHGTVKTKNSSYAPFGQITWTPPILNDKLSLTAGVRYTEDHVHSSRGFQCKAVYAPVGPGGALVNLCNLGIPTLNDFSASVGRTFGRKGSGFPGLSPMANVQYQWTEELMTYVRVSRGYQSGRVNDVVNDPSLLTTTSPERLEAYEAGFKSQWFDNRLRLNADGFLSRYKDQVVPLQRFSPTTGQQSTADNAGLTEVWGSEVEVVAVPFRGLEASVNYAYLKSKFLEYKAQEFVNGNPVFDQNGKPVIVNLADQRVLSYSPEHTVTVGLTYTAPPTSAGTFSAHLDMFWTDSYVGHFEPPYSDAAWAYAVFNGRLQLVDIPLANGSLDIAAFGRNLFDRKYRTDGFSLGNLGWAVDAYGDPRTFGLGLTYHFTAS